MQRRQHRRTASEPRSAAEIARAQLGGVSAIGVVCEVRLHRGGRQLTVKSSVEVVNNTDEPLLMFMPIDACAAAKRADRTTADTCRAWRDDEFTAPLHCEWLDGRLP